MVRYPSCGGSLIPFVKQTGMLELATTVFFSALVVGYIYWVNQYRGIQTPVLLLAITVMIMAYVSNNTRFGRYAYAIGGNGPLSRSQVPTRLSLSALHAYAFS